MLQMTFVDCIAILSNYFGGEVKFVLVAKVNKGLTRIFSEKISECFRVNTNASKTWLKYRPNLNHCCSYFNRKRLYELSSTISTVIVYRMNIVIDYE